MIGRMWGGPLTIKLPTYPKNVPAIEFICRNIDKLFMAGDPIFHGSCPGDIIDAHGRHENIHLLGATASRRVTTSFIVRPVWASNFHVT